MVNRADVFGTVDGGITWTHLDTLPSEEVITGLHFIDRHTGWMAGNSFGIPIGSHIFHTIDGGHTWDCQFETEEYISFQDIFFTDAEHGWVLGRRGEIYHYSVP